VTAFRPRLSGRSTKRLIKWAAVESQEFRPLDDECVRLDGNVIVRCVYPVVHACVQISPLFCIARLGPLAPRLPVGEPASVRGKSRKCVFRCRTFAPSLNTCLQT